MNVALRVLLSSLLLLSLVSHQAAAGPADSAKIDTKKIEQLSGLKGAYNEKEAVFKLSFPRSDLNVTSGKVKINNAMGLTSWVAFTRHGHHVMLMGDTVLTEDQVNPVMSVALENGLSVTGLHNHFFGENPKIMFMHISGMGDEEKLAAAIGKVYAKVKESLGAKGTVPTADIDPQNSSLDPKKIDSILGKKGETNAGVTKVTFGETTTMDGVKVGNAMGVNTWAAFTGSDSQALVDGDFAVRENELQPVLKKLRAADINIVAIHNHMTMENPRIIFLHYWGLGPTEQLARGIKSALDAQRESNR